MLIVGVLSIVLLLLMRRAPKLPRTIVVALGIVAAPALDMAAKGS